MRFSPRVDRISGEGAAAWKIHSAAMAARRAGADIIVMSIGDPDFATPPPIVERAVAALRAGDTHYTEIPGRPALRAAIARQHREGGGAEAGAANVIVLAGAQNALFAASLCLLSPGDEVLVPEPMYVTYEATVHVSGATLVSVPSRPGGGFRPDLDAIERAVTPRTRAILFANPNNPSGVVMSRAELEGMAGIARRHDLWVVADEVYAALTFDAPHISIAGLDGMAERTVTVGSVSKSHAMTGWRCGWLIAPEALVTHVENLSLCMLYGLPGFVQEGGIEALTRAASEAERMRDVYRRRRDLVCEALSGLPELSAFRPDAGMFLLVDVRGTGRSASDFAWRLFEEEGVSVLDATAFGASAAGFVRLSYTLGEVELTEGCARIRRFVERLRQGPLRARG
ncbi:MAG TPA: aminotransferase class I/II-fold pyridoxal phosphate-dependent enzyme [Propylenella sp.]